MHGLIYTHDYYPQGEFIIFKLITRQSQRLIEFLLPAQCLICALKSNNKLICLYCEKKILEQRSCCLHCALPLNKNADYCGDCLQKNQQFDHIHALGDYTKPLSTLIKQLKYQKQLCAGELLASLLIKSIQSRYSTAELSQFDYLLAVPLHAEKLQQRGFNQTSIICEKLHKKLHIPLLTQQIRRIKKTVAQEGLSIKQRNKNLTHAFSYHHDPKTNLSGKNIVIVDDVVTTGATVNSLCELLTAQQVNSITIFCISRTAIKAT